MLNAKKLILSSALIWGVYSAGSQSPAKSPLQRFTGGSPTTTKYVLVAQRRSSVSGQSPVKSVAPKPSSPKSFPSLPINSPSPASPAEKNRLHSSPPPLMPSPKRGGRSVLSSAVTCRIRAKYPLVAQNLGLSKATDLTDQPYTGLEEIKRQNDWLTSLDGMVSKVSTSDFDIGGLCDALLAQETGNGDNAVVLEPPTDVGCVASGEDDAWLAELAIVSKDAYNAPNLADVYKMRDKMLSASRAQWEAERKEIECLRAPSSNHQAAESMTKLYQVMYAYAPQTNNLDEWTVDVSKATKKSRYVTEDGFEDQPFIENMSIKARRLSKVYYPTALADGYTHVLIPEHANQDCKVFANMLASGETRMCGMLKGDNKLLLRANFLKNQPASIVRATCNGKDIRDFCPFPDADQLQNELLLQKALEEASIK